MQPPVWSLHFIWIVNTWDNGFKNLLYYLHIVLYIFIILLLLLWQAVWKTSFKSFWHYPLIICHHPLCFPVVFSEEGINQMLCHHLLKEPGRFSLLIQTTLDKHPHWVLRQPLTHGQSCGSCSKHLGQGHFPGVQYLLSKPTSLVLVIAPKGSIGKIRPMQWAEKGGFVKEDLCSLHCPGWLVPLRFQLAPVTCGTGKCSQFNSGCVSPKKANRKSKLKCDFFEWQPT